MFYKNKKSGEIVEAFFFVREMVEAENDFIPAWLTEHFETGAVSFLEDGDTLSVESEGEEVLINLLFSGNVAFYQDSNGELSVQMLSSFINDFVYVEWVSE